MYPVQRWETCGPAVSAEEFIDQADDNEQAGCRGIRDGESLRGKNPMWTEQIQESVLLITLGIQSIFDYREKLVRTRWLIPAVLTGMICMIWQEAGIEKLFWTVILFLLGIGASVGTAQAVGMGDVWILCCLCLNFGILDTLAILIAALLGAGIYGGGKLICGKAKRRDTIAFVPFLFLAYAGVLLLKEMA